jgi:hypothetical protein
VLPDFSEELHLDVTGGTFQYHILPGLYFGSSYLNTAVSQEVGFYKVKERFDLKLAEVWLDLQHEKVQVFANFAANAHEFDQLFRHYVNVYLAANYFIRDTGITLEYKSYKFGLADYLTMQNTYRHQRFLPIQNPPTVIREHSWTLLNRQNHQVDFNDEVGFQFEVEHPLFDQTTLILNTALASKHIGYKAVNSDLGFMDFERINSKPLLFPSLEKEYSPFWNILIEAEHYFANGSMINGGIAYLSETDYDPFPPTLSYDTQAYIFPFQLNYVLNPEYTCLFTVEYGRFSENSSPYFTNSIFSAGLSKTPWFTFMLKYERLSQKLELSDKNGWLTGSVQFRFRQKQVIEISYGDEKGGLICKNGLCRYIAPFSGWRVNTILAF